MPNYYEDAAPAQAEAPAKEEAPKEEAGDSQTAELPKSVLGGKEFKPGEEVMLQIVQVMEDSVLVKYASESEGEPHDEKAEQAEAPSPEMGGGGGNPGGGSMGSMYG
jgi:hypothetical protein